MSKESRNEAQGPCQTGSFMMNLLHPHLFRCRLEIGVLRQMRLIINSRIGIEAKSFYQLMNKCHWILCFWHIHFLFSCLLASMQLEAVRASMPCSTTKMANHWGLCCFLATGWTGCLGLVSLKSTLIFLVARISSFLTLTYSLGTDTGGTNLVSVNIEEEPLSKYPNLVLSDDDFWTLNMLSSLELEVLPIVL